MNITDLRRLAEWGATGTMPSAPTSLSANKSPAQLFNEFAKTFETRVQGEGPVTATKPEADAGTNNTKMMTPLQTKNAIAALSPKAANVAALDLTASAPFDEAELQAVADKVDALIAALVAANLMSAPA